MSRLSTEPPLDPRKPVEKAALSYYDVQKGLDVLIEKAARATPDMVLCIDRGGAIVGGIIAKRLRIPIRLVPRCGKDLKMLDFTTLQQELEAQNILIVDDASRTGTTLEQVVQATRRALPGKTTRVTVLLATHVTYGSHREETGLSRVDDFAYFTSRLDVRLPWDVR